jgi:transcriptional regulator with XRE-family HTH domain
MGSVLGFPGVDPLDAAVGARLKRWRETRGMAVDDLALLLHISAEEVRRAEAGRSHLDAARIGAATSALHLPLWALVSDTRAY